MSKTTLHIESMDSGYIVTQNGKTKAIEYPDAVKKILETIIINMTEKFTHASVKEMSISIEVEENPAKCLPDK